MNPKFRKALIKFLTLFTRKVITKILNKSNLVKDKPLIRLDMSGNLKIIQFADINYGPDTDSKTIELMDKVLDKEKPNLVVFTGDTLSEKLQSKEEIKKAVADIAEPMECRKLPWAVIFQKHDTGHFLLNTRQMLKLYRSFNCNLNETSTKKADKIENLTPSERKAVSEVQEFTVYMLDSGNYYFLGIYDYIHRAEIRWYKTVI